MTSYKDNSNTSSPLKMYTIHQLRYNANQPDEILPVIGAQDGVAYRLWNVNSVAVLFEEPLLQRWKHFFHNKIRTEEDRRNFSRYAILYAHGGACVEVRNNIQPSREHISQMRRKNLVLLGKPFLGSIPLTLLASSPVVGHWFWGGLMDYIAAKYPRETVLPKYCTGEVILYRYYLSKIDLLKCLFIEEGEWEETAVLAVTKKVKAAMVLFVAFALALLFSSVLLMKSYRENREK